MAKDSNGGFGPAHSVCYPHVSHRNNPYTESLEEQVRFLRDQVILVVSQRSSLERELDEARAYALGLREFIREIYQFLPGEANGRNFQLDAGEVLAKPMPEWLEDITKVKQEFDLSQSRHEE